MVNSEMDIGSITSSADDKSRWGGSRCLCECCLHL